MAALSGKAGFFVMGFTKGNVAGCLAGDSAEAGRSWVLGIHDGHNASVALSRDGEIVAAAQEERFTGRKNETGFPLQAATWLLRRFPPPRIEERPRVVFASIEQPPHQLLVNREASYRVADYQAEMRDYWAPKLAGKPYPLRYFQGLFEADPRFRPANSCYAFPESLWDAKTRDERIGIFNAVRRGAVLRLPGLAEAEVDFLDHHACHMAYACATSPHLSGRHLGLTLDAHGDGANQTVWEIRDGEMIPICRSAEADIGRLYRCITLHLGMKPLEDEFKVMGLAAYCPAPAFAPALARLRGLFALADGSADDPHGLRMVHAKRPPDLYAFVREHLADFRFDQVAAAAQAHLEETVLAWLSRALARTGLDSLLFSGGVAMNVKLNQKLAAFPGLRLFHVGGSSGDESLAIGACALGSGAVRIAEASRSQARARPNRPSSPLLGHLFLGPDPLEWHGGAEPVCVEPGSAAPTAPRPEGTGPTVLEPASTVPTSLEPGDATPTVHRESPGASSGAAASGPPSEEPVSFFERRGFAVRPCDEAAIADLLAAGEVVARMAGPMEFGARALGNRSLLCDPSLPDAVTRINRLIKCRDFWMPFALTVLDTYQERYLLNPKGLPSPFMALCMDANPAFLNEVRAGTHPYDATVRPQILKRPDNPGYYDLLAAFAAKTGRGALLNTSFNLHGKPLVRGLEAAAETLAGSGLKYLYLPPFLVEKPNS